MAVREPLLARAARLVVAAHFEGLDLGVVAARLDVTGSVALGTRSRLEPHADALPRRTNLRHARDLSRAAAAFASMPRDRILTLCHVLERIGPTLQSPEACPAAVISVVGYRAKQACRRRPVVCG
jgi:hypothetical protein